MNKRQAKLEALDILYGNALAAIDSGAAQAGVSDEDGVKIEREMKLIAEAMYARIERLRCAAEEDR